MFGLFGKGKKKDGAKAGAKKSREEIIAEAKANAAAAREHIGDETLQKIAAAMQKKQSGDTELDRLRNEIKQMDSGKVADNVKLMLDEDK